MPPERRPSLQPDGRANGKTLPDGSTSITSHSYAIDRAGNRTRAQEYIGTSTYVYDKLNRLTSASYPLDQLGGVIQQTFGYDDNGNRTSRQPHQGTRLG